MPTNQILALLIAERDRLTKSHRGLTRTHETPRPPAKKSWSDSNRIRAYQFQLSPRPKWDEYRSEKGPIRKNEEILGRPPQSSSQPSPGANVVVRGFIIKPLFGSQPSIPRSMFAVYDGMLRQF
jgi:hypothetical protein